MNFSNLLPLALGLILFSFFVNSALVVPFIDLLYKLKLTRRKQATERNAQSEGQKLFDKLHDIKSGTPIGGGILLIITILAIFSLIFPLVNKLGVYMQSSYPLLNELLVIFITFLTFGLLGFLDDAVKIFGKPKPGARGAIFGLTKIQKFSVQWVLGLFIGWFLYSKLGIHILHI
ncbi:hypothetical protein KW795_01205, partial [Candidatus Microgenomates bacterium]|nr:hypothetical protein [Candidatus Microgenomates bacterium]